jgi:hypothetical protein
MYLWADLLFLITIKLYENVLFWRQGISYSTELYVSSLQLNFSVA